MDELTHSDLRKVFTVADDLLINLIKLLLRLLMSIDAVRVTFTGLKSYTGELY